MPKKNSTHETNNHLSRRDFLTMGSAAALGLAAGASLPGKSQAAKPAGPEKVEQEWRNKQSDMSYRQLGRTGMMVSEVVCGGDPVRPDNYQHIAKALEMGMNYLDMAPAYGRGQCEEAYGKILDEFISRDQVFMTTKVSGFNWKRNQLYQDIYDGLPSEKQEKYQQKAQEMMEKRAVVKPGYFFEYFPNQDRQFQGTYLSNAMMPDYGHKVEGSKEFRTMITESLEGSLKRTGTDHFDILMCPHGANSPEEVQVEEIYKTLDDLKQSGKVRYLGVSSHNDPAGVLMAARETGQYDVAMVAYNIANGGYLDIPIQQAADAGVGIIGMKVAMAVATHHKALQPVPQWRIDKVNRIVPGDMKAPLKAYTWALQNPNVTAVISNLWDEQYVQENLSVAGTKVELNKA